jgi:ubiquinone/menaquinone biosynthesis C-methylase UbiE
MASTTVNSPEEAAPESTGIEYRKRIKGDRAAEAYKHRKKSKDRAELHLVQKALPYLPEGGTVLDAPCGNGRMTALLAEAGFQATGVDLSEGTLAISQEEVMKRGLKATFEKRDLEALDYQDSHFDGTLCFRFFHHLPTDEIRDRVIGELCRVTRKTVLISYMSPWSPTMLKRRLRHALGGKKSQQHATPLTDLKAFFARHGFHLSHEFAQRRFQKSLHLACFVAEKRQ